MEERIYGHDFSEKILDARIPITLADHSRKFIVVNGIFTLFEGFLNFALVQSGKKPIYGWYSPYGLDLLDTLENDVEVEKSVKDMMNCGNKSDSWWAKNLSDFCCSLAIHNDRTMEPESPHSLPFVDGNQGGTVDIVYFPEQGLNDEEYGGDPSFGDSHRIPIEVGIWEKPTVLLRPNALADYVSAVLPETCYKYRVTSGSGEKETILNDVETIREYEKKNVKLLSIDMFVQTLKLEKDFAARWNKIRDAYLDNLLDSLVTPAEGMNPALLLRATRNLKTASDVLPIDPALSIVACSKAMESLAKAVLGLHMNKTITLGDLTTTYRNDIRISDFTREIAYINSVRDDSAHVNDSEPDVEMAERVIEMAGSVYRTLMKRHGLRP
jgi:hypothetical protein